MRQQIAILLFALLLLSSCTSAPENKPAAPAENIPQTEEAPPADAAPEAPLQTEPETPAEPELVLDEETKDYVRWSALTGLQDGVPPVWRADAPADVPRPRSGDAAISVEYREWRSASTWFSRVHVSPTHGWSEEIWNGFVVLKGCEATYFHDALAPDWLYLVRPLRRYRGQDNESEHYPLWKLTDYDVGEYGRTLQKIYYLTPDGTQLMQMEADGSGVTCIYAAPSGKLCSLICCENTVWCAEQMDDGSWRIWRLYEPEIGTAETSTLFTVLEQALPTAPTVQVLSNCETAVWWTNPEMTRKREELKEEYWTELWENQTEQEREWFISRYLDAHPDYVDDGGIPPYDETLLPQGSGDVVITWINQRYHIPERYVRYRNTITGYVKTMGNLFATREYFFLDGTTWERPYEPDEEDSFVISPFWLYLPPDDAS